MTEPDFLRRDVSLREEDLLPQPPRPRWRMGEMAGARVDLKDLGLAELETFVETRGNKRYRARQIIQWLYQKDVSSFDDMTNLSKDFRAELARDAYISRLLPAEIHRSTDGSRKFLFRLADGGEIESVVMPEEGRLTLCISTQVGCPVACRFCVTGLGGVKRNLSTSEILGQIQAAVRDLQPGERLTNVVVMGMGEPLLNYDNLVRSLKLSLMDETFGLSHRRITVSTSGIVPNMRRLGHDLPVNLAVSLNATTEEQRREVMPISKKWGIEEVLEACRDYPLAGNKLITFEYVLLAGVNDSPADAARLFRLVKGIRCKINLIPYNENPWMEYRRPSVEVVKSFQHYLVSRHLLTTVRWSRAGDVGGACGQLGATQAQAKAGPPPGRAEIASSPS